MKKKLLKIFFVIVAVLTLIIIAALAYLNLVYLPQKVKSVGAAYLEEKTRGQVQAESIQYIPFRGIRLKNIAILSKTKEPILTIDKLYFNVNLWPLIIRREIDFRIDLYPPKIRRPFVFKGLYQVKQKTLDMDFKIKNNLFVQRQTIYGKALARCTPPGCTSVDIDLNLSSPDLNVQGIFYIKERDLRIEKFSGNILQSTFDFIGDVQNLSDPFLNIYGNLELNLTDLKDINPEYAKTLNKLSMEGRCGFKIFISSKPGNPQIGLKCKAAQIKIEKTKIEDLSIIAEMENKRVSLSKFYARLYDGEVNLQGMCRLDSRDFPANLNLNIFNLELNKLIKDITGKDTPLHGRFFSLGRLEAPLKDPKAVTGKLWVSAAGSNILQLPIFTGIADVLRLPEMRKVEFKEASGNFSIAKQAIRTSDFKIASNNIVIYYKGYIDFAGNLAFDVEPTFSPSFLAAPNIGNILRVFIDPAGNFLGEIKLKGNIKEARHTFKPSIDRLLPGVIEQFFKFKKKEK